jgi:signal transduction histidine kinase
MARLSAQVKDLSSDVHHLSYRLHPRWLERLGLLVALKSLCREISEQLKVHLDVDDDEFTDPISDDVALCIYRVAQESLRNVVKHSRAKDARVVMSRETRGIRLLIIDTGIGFDPEDVSRHKGLGLISMRERLRAVGGQISIRSEPGEGTEIEIFAPTDDNNGSEY